MFHVNCGQYYSIGGYIDVLAGISSLGQCLERCAANSLCVAVTYLENYAYCDLLGSSYTPTLNTYTGYDSAYVIH